MIPSSEDNELTALPSRIVSMDLVRFERVDSKYHIHENIIVEYSLDAAVQQSSHNWVGMFPRGFSNLQQYITFEWTIVSPRETLSLHQTIEFLSKYHASNVHFNQQYQFLFVSKDMEVLGGSSYFYFIPPDESSSIRKGIYNEQPSTVQPPVRFRTTPQPCASSVTMSEAQKKQAQLQKQHYLKTYQNLDTKIRTSQGEEYQARSDHLWRNMSLQEENQTTSNQHCCPQCKQPKNAADACEKLIAKVKSTAEHARILETKLQQVEQALEMSQVSRKVLQLAAHHAKQERMVYQKFLNELIVSLSEKGAVRVILGQGTEMILKKVTDEVQETTPKKTYTQESFLKAIIGSQEQTIRDMQAQLECIKLTTTTTTTTTGCPMAQPIMSNIKIDPKADHPCIKESVDLDAVGNNNDTLNKTYSIDQSVTMKHKQQQVLKELSQVLTRRRKGNEQQSEADWWSENRRELDPTTVVVKGDYAKFAIIRTGSRC